jgi:glycine cleavage system H protein
MDYELLEDIKYTSSHEWVRIEGNLATIGITDYAQHQLGDIVFVELPNIGDTIDKGTTAGEIESVKAVGELLMPLSGEIVEVNENLKQSPEIVNESPYKNGWMIKAKLSNTDEIKGLLSLGDYKKVVENEEK